MRAMWDILKTRYCEGLDHLNMPCEATKSSCNECLIVCAKPKSHLITLWPQLRGEGGGWLCCSALNWYVNIYVVTRINCHSTRKGGRLREGCQNQTNQMFEHLEDLLLFVWAYPLSCTCAGSCTPGFLFTLQLEESCWYDVSHSCCRNLVQDDLAFMYIWNPELKGDFIAL